MQTTLSKLVELWPPPASPGHCDWNAVTKMRGGPVPEEVVMLGDTYGQDLSETHKLIVPVDDYYYDLRDWIETTVDMYQPHIDDGCTFRYPVTDPSRYLPWLVDEEATFAYLWQKPDENQLVVFHSWTSFWMAEYLGSPTELLIELVEENTSLTDVMSACNPYEPDPGELQ